MLKWADLTLPPECVSSYQSYRATRMGKRLNVLIFLNVASEMRGAHGSAGVGLLSIVKLDAGIVQRNGFRHRRRVAAGTAGLNRRNDDVVQSDLEILYLLVSSLLVA